MRDTLATTGLVMTWVPVRDDDGRVRLEAHWTVPGAAVQRPYAA